LTTAGHPILGDPVYRTRRWRDVLPPGAPPVERQLLHAHALGFVHPLTKEPVRFEDPIPEDMARFLEFLRRKA
jgi:23S rRNA pseudouridine1911/1915/1917 synthase